MPDGLIVFIDSNIFTYFLLNDEEYFFSCRRFLERIENGDLIGVINGIVISETLFSYVVDRIAKREEIDPGAVVRKTKKNPELIGETDISEIMKIFSLPNRYMTPPGLKLGSRNSKKCTRRTFFPTTGFICFRCVPLR